MTLGMGHLQGRGAELDPSPGATERRLVLLVAANREDRGRYSSWLEESDLEVLACPGPSAPDYTCVGSRAGACPLATDADVVVLDTSLPGDDLHEGTSVTDLVTLYCSLGKPVIGLATLARDVPNPAGWLRWPPTATELVAAVRERVLRDH